MLLLELYIVYLKQYDTYYDTHEAIFYMYEQYILFSLIPNNVICPQISWEFGKFNGQNTLNLSQNVLFDQKREFVSFINYNQKQRNILYYFVPGIDS